MNEIIGKYKPSETFLFDSLKQNQIMKENKICKPPVFNFGV